MSTPKSMERCEKTLHLCTSPLCLSTAPLHLSTTPLHLSTLPLHLSSASLHLSTAPPCLSTAPSTLQNPREGSHPSSAPSPCLDVSSAAPSKSTQHPGEGSHPSSTPSPCPQLQPPQGAVTQGDISLSFPHEIKEKRTNTACFQPWCPRRSASPHDLPRASQPNLPTRIADFFLGWGSAFSAQPRDFLEI